MNIDLAVSETFKSIQGEGLTMGQPAYFLRLGGCNLLCGGIGTDKDGKLHDGAEWRCDTIEVFQKSTKCSVEGVIEMLGGDTFISDLSNNCLLIVTGGEPLLQQSALRTFFKALRLRCEYTPAIEIETNGTITPDLDLVQYVHQWNVSPKLKNSGMPLNKRYKRNAIEFFVQDSDAIFKFVVQDQSDWTEVLNEWIKPNEIPKDRIWLMPSSENREALITNSQEVAEICRDYNINFSSM